MENLQPDHSINNNNNNNNTNYSRKSPLCTFYDNIRWNLVKNLHAHTQKKGKEKYTSFRHNKCKWSMCVRMCGVRSLLDFFIHKLLVLPVSCFNFWYVSAEIREPIFLLSCTCEKAMVCVWRERGVGKDRQALEFGICSGIFLLVGQHRCPVLACCVCVPSEGGSSQCKVAHSCL